MSESFETQPVVRCIVEGEIQDACLVDSKDTQIDPAFFTAVLSGGNTALQSSVIDASALRRVTLLRAIRESLETDMRTSQ